MTGAGEIEGGRPFSIELCYLLCQAGDHGHSCCVERVSMEIDKGRFREPEQEATQVRFPGEPSACFTRDTQVHW